MNDDTKIESELTHEEMVERAIAQTKADHLNFLQQKNADRAPTPDDKVIPS